MVCIGFKIWYNYYIKIFNMSKTKPSFKETKLGILEIKEIEWIIFDNLIQVKSYIFRNFKINIIWKRLIL